MKKSTSTSHDTAIADLVERALVEPDELSRDIEKVARAASAFATSRLKFSTLVTLIAEDSKVGKRDVEKVLLAAMSLNAKHLKPTGGKK